MTTATLATGNRTVTEVRPRRSLEELVDQLMAALFKEEPQTEQPTETLSVAKSVHEARRLRQAGEPVSSTGQAVDGALAVLVGTDTTKAEPHQARSAYAEWTDLVKRRFGDRDVMVYSQDTGQAPPWRPSETAARLRSRRSWECGGGPARSSRSAASGGSGPCRRLALGPDRRLARRWRSASNG